MNSSLVGREVIWRKLQLNGDFRLIRAQLLSKENGMARLKVANQFRQVTVPVEQIQEPQRTRSAQYRDV